MDHYKHFNVVAELGYAGKHFLGISDINSDLYSRLCEIDNNSM